MQELGVAAALLERVSLFAEQHGGLKVSAIGICLGELSGVDSHALVFGFESLTKNTRFAEVRLRIERHASEPNGSSSHTGEELDLSYVEMEEAKWHYS
jgi:Zn finger protein HypA/HybF involved in hydrogenase expression